MTTSIEERLEALEAQVKTLNSVDFKRIRVKYMSQKSKSGVEIVGGPTVVENEGTFLGVQMMPIPNNPQGAALGVVILGDDNTVVIAGVEGCQFL